MLLFDGRDKRGVFKEYGREVGSILCIVECWLDEEDVVEDEVVEDFTMLVNETDLSESRGVPIPILAMHQSINGLPRCGVDRVTSEIG